MPSTVSGVVSKFERRLSDLLRDYGSLLSIVRGQRRQASLETLLAEQAVMSLNIFWEAFFHDLIVALVLEEPAQCIEDHVSRIEDSVKSKFPAAANWIRLTPPASLRKEQLEKLLDPKGFNVTMPETSKLASFANSLFQARIARRFALSGEDEKFFEFLAALRNFMAHRSSGSKVKLKNAVDKLDGSTDAIFLKASTSRFDIYIKHSEAGRSRLDCIAANLLRLARQFGGI